MKWNDWSRIRAGILGMAGAIGVVALVQASIPDRSGVIRGCYSETTGALRVVDGVATCPKGESGLVWNTRGPQGIQGAQGLPGVSGPVRVQADSPMDAVATKEVFAQCPSGTHVLGGGYTFFFGGPTVPPRDSVPSVNLDGWYVGGTNVENTPWSISAVAMCARTN